MLSLALETSQPLLEAHRQTLVLDMPSQPVWLDGDLVRLSQLFSNLVINASKFSADLKPIHLSARLAGDHVAVTVRDEGIGIVPALQAGVFELFTQGPTVSSSMASGLGIGLSLVRTIAQLHGATVEVFSEGVGHGSAFTVTLPVMAMVATEPQDRRAVPAQPLVRQAPPFKARHILLIDDNTDVNQTLHDFLVDVGHVVDCAPDGETGLQMDSERRHDVICCDIGLPGMDGFEVARRLRRGASRARLIAISGYEQEEQRERARQAGFDHYLVKPIVCQQLLALIDRPENEPT